MTVSEKQLKANKKNAQKGGVKTEEGKAIAKYNALKHGLLAKEVVVTVGEGAENPEEFKALLDDLQTQLAPSGILEVILVEKVAVAYWRLRRAYIYEVGVIRSELDSAADNYYSGETSLSGYKTEKTNEEIDREIEQQKEAAESWKQDKKDFTKMHKARKPLEEIYDWDENWEWLWEKFEYLVAEDKEFDGFDPETFRKSLNNYAGWSDDRIWQEHIDLCEEKISGHEKEIAELERKKEKNKLRLQVAKKLGNIPSKDELDRLLRYEGAIERQLYKALNQLERLQRLRAGDNVPPPVEVDVDVNTG
jgi:hypothetical protein